MTELATQTRDVLSFGPFSLVTSERLLTKDGAEVELGGRALDLLLRLVAHPNQPIGKRQLLAEVWPDLTVGESSLRFHMANLRKALGDGRDGARYITTFSGRGYCFVAPLSRAGPPTSTPLEVVTNLPLRPALIGREEELADVVDLLGKERLVTIVGPGGVGKTRLAIAVGRRSTDAYPDGAWLVDLAPLSDPSLVVSAVATALDLARGATELSAALIASAIGDRRLLLILDNCEHLVGPTTALADELLQSVPGLTILATSQENLRLDTEQVYRLGPLALPPSAAVDVAGYGAVALFAQRALSVDRRFDMNDANAAGVADICRRLDGVPLSLEMAAARVPSLGLEGLRASLDARLQVLSTGLRTSDVRHQTLRNTVAWSVGLLDETEKLVFRTLGVFSGGFSLEAAMAVVATGRMDRWAVAGAVARLVDKSLVALETAEPARYRLLETLRLYARELLQATGEWDRLAESHARYFCAVFAPALDAWETIGLPEWQSNYIPELDNLRSALDWALADPARFDLAVELTASAGFIWVEWGLVEEGWRFTGRVMNLFNDRTPPAYAAAILHHAGRLLGQSDQHAARSLSERSAAVFRQLGDEPGLAKANLSIANHLLLLGERHSDAAAVMRGVREALSASGHKRSLCSAMNTLGVIATGQQNVAEAIDNFRSATQLAGQLKDERFEHLAIVNLAVLEFSRGDVERAIQLGRESLSGARRLLQRGDRVSRALHNLAAFLIAANRLGEARPVAEEAFSLLRGQANAAGRLTILQMWALIAAMEEQYPEASRLVGWVDAAYERTGGQRNPWEQRSNERLLSLLGARLSEGEMSTLAAEGARWDATEAFNFAFDRIVRSSAGAGTAVKAAEIGAS
jgi:predicted ATPase/DNA-binding winged helix-turn-helix (wHTH) protein